MPFNGCGLDWLFCFVWLGLAFVKLAERGIDLLCVYCVYPINARVCVRVCVCVWARAPGLFVHIDD